MLYHLKQDAVDQIKALLKDHGFDPDNLDDAFDELEPETVVANCDNRLNYPLLLDNLEEYHKHESAMIMIPAIKRRLEGLIDYLDGDLYQVFDTLRYSFVSSSEGHWSDGAEYSLTDLIVFSCVFPVHLFGEDAFTLDYEKYGFRTWEDLVFSIGAHILNERECKYQEKINFWISEVDGRIYKNYFFRYIHGDFRFEQIDVTPNEKTISPFGDTVSFFKVDGSRKRYIIGYHSVEDNFLLIIKHYAQQIGAKSKIFDDYESYYQEFVKENDLSLGNFADAGCNISPFFMFCDEDIIPSINDDVQHNPFSISQEFEGKYSAYIDGEDLIFSLAKKGQDVNLAKSVRFSPSDIDDIIHHLHLQCASGMGRTSVENLYHAMNREKQKGVHHER